LAFRIPRSWLSRAVTNALANCAHRRRRTARVLLTTFGLNLGIGLIGGLVLYIFGGFMLRYFISAPDALGPEISRSLPWIACLLPLTLVSATGAGALESRELFLLVNSIQIVTLTLAQVAPVIAAVLAPRLRWLSRSGCGAGVGRDRQPGRRLSSGRPVFTSRRRLGRGVVLGSLTNRAKHSPPANTNPQK
jgi:MatE